MYNYENCAYNSACDPTRYEHLIGDQLSQKW